MTDFGKKTRGGDAPGQLYGRRKGRPLRVRKSRLMLDLLPQLEITVDEGKRLDVAALFPFHPRALWCEIGFGGGEHLAAQAARHADTGFIGCEPFVNGIASLLDHIERQNLRNICIYPGDARLLLDALPDAALERCYILFADPWPKARHAERRFVGAENLARLARVLRPGGALRLATDDAGLKAWMRERLAETRDFRCVSDAVTPPDDWVPTRYEQKARAVGRVPEYWCLERS
jgi:tRNA (guanine-N7-)-methyltransferase